MLHSFVHHAPEGRQDGEGQLILFLHGVPDNWTLYMSQFAEFSQDHMVVAPNLRGFPPSDQPKAIEAYAMPRLLAMYLPCFGISAVTGASWWAMTGVAALLGFLLRPIQAVSNA
jgi:pimeloyl-ACP methyl ester carboxylesterase